MRCTMNARKITLLIMLGICSRIADAQTIETIKQLTVSSPFYAPKTIIVNEKGSITAPAGGEVIISGHYPFTLKANRAATNLPSWDKNFSRTQMYRPDPSEFLPEDMRVRQTTFEYVNGLGVPVQTVKMKCSPNQKDVVSFQLYDTYGREPKTYLPFTSDADGKWKRDPVKRQQSFYNGTPAVAKDSAAFAKALYDDSPLNRVRASHTFGWQWHAGLPATTSVRLNIQDQVRLLRLDGQELPSWKGEYIPAKHLTISESKDEAGQVKSVFKDFRGSTVMQRVGDSLRFHDTYYLHDVVGRVRYIFPPEASSRIDEYMAATDKLAFLDKWCFQYKYDLQGRVIEKKSPGGPWTFSLYDRWDRIACTQDGNQRLANEWLFTKYDMHNRPIITGVVRGTRAEMQDGIKNSTVRFEERARNSIGYTNNAFPTHSEDRIFSISYYDSYNFIKYPDWDKESINFRFNGVDGIVTAAEILFQMDSTAVQTLCVRGRATGSKVRVLNSNPVKWLNSVTYYTRQYHVAQSIVENHLGGRDVTSSKYDKFSGAILKSKVDHQTASGRVTVMQEFDYDDENRLLRAYHSINGNPRILMSAHRYNELGQLVQKNLHSTDSKSFLQSVDYRYNIQGWMSHINNSTLNNDSITNDDSDDLFGMEVIFNEAVDINGSAFKSAKSLDGNVSAVKWMTNALTSVVPQHEKIYGYQYDVFKRLSKSYYATKVAGSWTGNAANFNEDVNFYDNNGNLGGTSAAALLRNGLANGTRTSVDHLAYRYSGNRLMNVKDLSSHQFGFIDKPGVDLSVDEFKYDANGNMIEDMNKSITSIKYNHLNLPYEIIFTRVSPARTDKVVYTYDATGKKLRSEVLIGAQTAWVTDYVNGVQYDQSRMSHLRTAEGRAVYNGKEFNYEYFLKDHQGNVRVVCGLLNETASYKATMENQLEDREKNTYGFRNIPQTRFLGVNITAPSEEVYNPDKSARCNAFSNDGNAAVPIGPAKSLRVSTGDAVYTEVYARFNNAKTSTSGILPSLLGSFVNAAFNITMENPTLFNGINAQAGLISPGLRFAEIVPKGYIALLYFDASFNFKRAAAHAISESAYRAFEKLTISFTAEQDGYVYIYVANESNINSSIDVYFDDFYIIHEQNKLKPQVLQASDYYPFGLSFNQYHADRLQVVSTSPSTVYEPTLRNRYLFQGQELQKELNVGWYQYKYRMHDPAIGRFSSIDPLSEDYVYNSPYAFSENVLTNAIELEGAESKVLYETMKFISPVAFKFDVSFTSHDLRVGANVSYGLPKGLPVSIRKEVGTTFNFSDIMTGLRTTETRSATETSYLHGLVSFQSTRYTSSDERDQSTGMVTVGLPGLNLQYENDFHPADKILSWADPFRVHAPEGGDGGDRWRTAAMSLNLGMFQAGFNLGTGDPGPNRLKNTYKGPDALGKAGVYVPYGENGMWYDPNRYRLGLAYAGTAMFRLGVDGESIRHQIQNVWTHDNLPNSPWFEPMPSNNQLYFGFSNGSPTQW
jgi:RHS repeat-associated protein